MLTRQFYDWEMRGRGWRVFSYPVRLEPPFRGLYYYDTVPGAVEDDGRVPSFFGKLFGNSGGDGTKKTDDLEAEYLAQIAEMDEPVVCDHLEEEFIELQLILPKEQKVAKPFVDRLVASATYCTNPISFEVVGTPNEVVVQMSATERDLPQLRQQLRAFFPDSHFLEVSNGFLERAWGSGEGRSQIADFGLSNEFMIPLATVLNLDLDPLLSIVGALNELEYDEVGVFQVLFQKVKSNWGSEIMDSVRFRDGKPVFSDAPEMVALAKQKIGSQLYAAVVRVAAKAPDAERVWRIVRGIAAGMAQLSTPMSNELIPLSNEGYDRESHEQAMMRRWSFRCGMILNLDELVSLVHPPSISVRAGKLHRAVEVCKAAPSSTRGHSFVIGHNTYQQTTTPVTLSNDQRTRHVHLVGSSGSGKSTLLLNLIKQDLDSGQCLCVIDPHGDLIDEVVGNLPENRIDDVVLFDPSDSEFPIGFNILHANSPLEKAILSSDLIAIFRRMSTSWGDVMDSVLANALLAFIESTRGGTLFDLKRFLVEKEFRAEFLESVTDETVRYFWEKEFDLLAGRPQSSILIRLDAFLRQSLIRNIVCQKENKLDFRHIMDEGKVLLIKLSQGLIGEENAYLLGTMLVSRIYQSALTRQDSRERPHFWLYLDEFHHFVTPSMERVLSGTRKYHLGLVLAHQEFRQLQSRSQEVASSVLSNCYTRICFRLGDADSVKFADGFSYFDSKALQNLGIGEAIARVGRADHDFNLAVTQVPPISEDAARRRKDRATLHSRTLFSRARADVEAEISAARPLRVPPGRKKQPTPEYGGAEKPFESPGNAAKGSPTGQVEVSGEHRYLQDIIKRIGEDNGFIATLEKPVFGGVGKIDVACERDGCRIACEVALSNATEYELRNIQKCLAAGFDWVVVISPDPRHLKNIRNRADLILARGHQSRVLFLEPENFHLFLQRLGEHEKRPDAEPQRIKGYEVKTLFKETSKSEKDSKRRVIMDVLSRALRRRKGPDNE